MNKKIQITVELTPAQYEVLSQKAREDLDVTAWGYLDYVVCDFLHQNLNDFNSLQVKTIEDFTRDAV
jgi:hypothetical protein